MRSRRMSVQSHIEALTAKHATLEHELHTEQCRPSPDLSRISSIKRRKLEIKDEINRITH
ncbi:YdcH family protein [Thalassospira sp.]|uniref:YdcH family protein n=2 Tax=Thalassospira TaxID=168934 RepID=UPI003AA907E6